MIETRHRTLRIVVVDDHALVRCAIVGVIEGVPDMEVVGACADAGEALDLARREQPDVVVMDIDMPGPFVFEVANEIQRLVRPARIVFLTAYPHDTYIERALAIEAAGFLTKNEQPANVLASLRAVCAGGSCFSPEVEDRLVLDADGVRLARRTGTRMSTLSPRELEVLQHVASGMTKKEIAGMMHLSVKTIDNHCTNLMGKLDIHDRVELTKYAIREGLITA